VRHPPQVPEQGARPTVELIVQTFDGGLLEDALAPGLALWTAQQDAPVAGPFLGPVERIGKLAATVKADVQGLGGACPIGCLELIAAHEVGLLTAGRLRALPDVWVVLGVHGRFPVVIDGERWRL
jgi:hypothetical protein